MSVEQGGSLRNEDKVGGDLCQEVTELMSFEVLGLAVLGSPWSLNLDKSTLVGTIKISNLSTQN